jgi:hypothetical protein
LYLIYMRHWRLILFLTAVAAALVPLPPRLVERAYSNGVYLAAQPLFTGLSNRAPIALFDLLIVVVAGAWMASAARDLGRSGGTTRAALSIAVRTGTWAAALYLLFLMTWGLNYRRVPLAEKLPFDVSRVTADWARAAGSASVARLNALYDGAHREGWPPTAGVDPALAGAFDRAIREAGIPRPVAVGRPKRTLLDWYFRRAGVDGMTDPFFLETLVSRSLLPFERPLVVAHEWSHLAGIADEGEANFIAWLACLRGSTAHQYSGWLFLYGELARAVGARDRAALEAALAAGPRNDLQAIHDRFVRDVNPAVSDAGWRVYDSYLKANRVEAGAASYGEVVRLVLGVQLADTPFARVPD